MFLVRLWGQHLVAMRTTVELDLVPLGNIGRPQTGREQALTASVSSMPRLPSGRHVDICNPQGQRSVRSEPIYLWSGDPKGHTFWRGIHGKER